MDWNKVDFNTTSLIFPGCFAYAQGVYAQCFSVAPQAALSTKDSSSAVPANYQAHSCLFEAIANTVLSILAVRAASEMNSSNPCMYCAMNFQAGTDALSDEAKCHISIIGSLV